MKSKLSAALVAAGCALVLSFGAANADIITLDVAGTMIAESGTASCSPACTLGGSFVLDNSTGHLISSNITMAGGSHRAWALSLHRFQPSTRGWGVAAQQV
jgi:hypothetical protein